MAAVDAVVGSWRTADIGNYRVERRSSHGQADLDRDNPRSLHVADLVVWVELRGFEPLTPSMRTRCATGLRYSPKTGSQRSKSIGLAEPAVSRRRPGRRRRRTDRRAGR